MTYGMILGNCLLPQLFWSPALRRSVPVLVIVSAGRAGRDVFRAHPDPLQHAVDRLRADDVDAVRADRSIDGLILFGTGGLFVLLFLLLSRVIPLVPMYEIRELAETAR